jgi:hypothetical protein
MVCKVIFFYCCKNSLREQNNSKFLKKSEWKVWVLNSELAVIWVQCRWKIFWKGDCNLLNWLAFMRLDWTHLQDTSAVHSYSQIRIHKWYRSIISYSCGATLKLKPHEFEWSTHTSCSNLQPTSL